MTRTIPQRELRNDNARVIDAVVSGERFVITRNGLAVAELVPVQTNRPSFVRKSELLAISMRVAHIDCDQFRADLNRVID